MEETSKGGTWGPSDGEYIPATKAPGLETKLEAIP